MKRMIYPQSTRSASWSICFRTSLFRWTDSWPVLRRSWIRSLNKVLARIRYENKHPLKFGRGEIEIDDIGDEKGDDEWE